MLAANIGAGSTVGAAGLGYRDGLSAWWWVGSAGVGSIFLAVWVGPRIRRVAAERGFHTVGDFLEYRYGQSVRAIIAALLWLGTIAILAAQLIAIGWILNVVAGVDPWVGCVIGGLVVTVYFTAGGLLTAAWINVLQLAVLITGFLVALPIALGAVGGWSHVVEATHGLDRYWNVWAGGNSGWFYLAMLGPAFIISPGLLQKVYGAKDDRTVRFGVGLNAVYALNSRSCASAVRHDRALGLSVAPRSGPGAADTPDGHSATARRSARTRCAVFCRGKLVRRDPVHVGHFPLAGPVSTVCPS